MGNGITRRAQNHNEDLATDTKSRSTEEEGKGEWGSPNPGKKVCEEEMEGLTLWNAAERSGICCQIQ